MKRLMQRTSRSGSHAVEFALTAPVLLMVTAGMIDWGSFYNTQMDVVSISRDAIRVGIVTQEDSTDDDTAGQCSTCTVAAETAAATLLTTHGIDPTTATTNTATLVDLGGGVCGLQLELNITFEPLAGGLVPVAKNLWACNTMALENGVFGCNAAPTCS